MHHSGEPADLVVNCTGLGALKLGGVEDKHMMPIRGQIVVVRNEANLMCSTSGTDDGEDEVCYIMQRAAGMFLNIGEGVVIDGYQGAALYSGDLTRRATGILSLIPTLRTGS